MKNFVHRFFFTEIILSTDQRTLTFVDFKFNSIYHLKLSKDKNGDPTVLLTIQYNNLENLPKIVIKDNTHLIIFLIIICVLLKAR